MSFATTEKRIAGKIWTRVGWSFQKRQAQKSADFNRKHGDLARVLPEYNAGIRRNGYSVYVRYGKRKA